MIFRQPKNTKLLANIFSIFLLVLLLLPPLALAANPYTPLITCGNGQDTANSCTFSDFIDTINRIINWIISIAGVAFAVSLVYGGFLYMTSGDSASGKSKATEIMWNTLKGFVIILVAWVVVYTILNTLVDKSKPGNSDIFNFIKKF